MKRVFLDTAYFIALAVKDDQHHGAALRLARQLDVPETELVTTRAIVLEIGNSLRKPRYRRNACEIFDLLENDGRVRMVELEPRLLQSAAKLFCSRPDKEWSLSDCVSFSVMHEWQISEALTTDVHFEQAGFKALLREK